MSKPPRHPVFVARTPSGAGCGHQHKRRGAAWNCGDALRRRALRQRMPLPYVDVVEVTRDGEKQLDRLAKL